MVSRKSILLAAFVCNGWIATSAMHILGGEITLACQGGNQYEVTLILYRDCAGISMGSTQTIDVASPCGNLTLTVALDDIEEVSPLCAGDLSNSTCNGGSLPGVQAYTYTGITTLVPCDAWNLSWVACCRNNAVTNLDDPGTLDTYLEATMNNAVAACPRSPVFTSQPVAFFCQSQPSTYSFNAVGTPGDSLGYAFISAMAAGGVPAVYGPGYSFDQPIPGITLDPLTGVVSFTPTLLGNFVVVVQVSVYRDGELVFTIMRDIQLAVIACSNVAPDASAGVITNLTGSATLSGPYSIELCETDSFCFDFTLSDPDIGQNISISSTALSVLPGATLNTTGTNPITGTLCWSAGPGSSGFHVFAIMAQDDDCPVTASTIYAYTVNVIERTYAGPDLTICGDQDAALEATGGGTFTWSVLSGDPINVGVNFSCNPCAGPEAHPSVTTTYIVQSDLAGTCINADTVTVHVVPDFSLEASAAPGSYCMGEPVQLGALIAPGGPGFTIAWSPATDLNDPSIADPVAVFNTPGVHELVVNVTSPDGCSRQDTVIVEIGAGFAPLFTVTQDDLEIPCGGSTQFHVTLDGTGAAPCQGAPGGCTSGTMNMADVGTGTAFGTTTSYPAIYGNWYTGGRNQILYRASELNAIGFSEGIITSVGFNIANIPGGAATTYYDFEIKIGCTLLDAIPGTWITGLTTVFPAADITIASGWNTHELSLPFAWDGISNLIVEVCFDFYNTLGTSFTSNAPNYFTPTSYNSVHEQHSDGGGVCGEPPFVIESVSLDRPNIRFEYCASFDPADLVYQWTPPGDLSDPNGADPVVTPSNSPATYVITITDINTGCDADTALTVTFTSGESCSFTADNTSGSAPLTVNFTNTSTAGLSGFNWAVNGLGFATTMNASYTFTTDGFYEVTLTATDGGSCTYVSSMAIIVGAVGIVEQADAALSVHPIPAQDMLIVELRDSERITGCAITDLSGREVFSSTVRQGSTGPLRLDVSRLTAGTYLLVVLTDGGRLTTTIVIAR